MSYAPVPSNAVAIRMVPKDKANMEITFAIVFLSIAWVTVLLRLWTRAFVVRSLWWDDWCMVMTVVRPRSNLII
jgi:hypothetical protein